MNNWYNKACYIFDGDRVVGMASDEEQANAICDEHNLTTAAYRRLFSAHRERFVESITNENALTE